MSSERVLVVDDDAAIRRLISAILKREGYVVDTAGGGREALAKIELDVYDVVLLDLMMPDVDGLVVLKILYERLPQSRCVVILSAASSFDVARAINPNVFAAIRKPFDNSELLDQVRACIAAACALETPPQPAATAA